MDSTQDNQPVQGQPTTPPPGVVPAAQPNQPSQTTQTPPQGTQPNQPSDSDQSMPNQPSVHARIFDKILNGMTGGDIKVVGPDGTVSSYRPSGATLGKSIVAAALTGLFTPPQYRQGAYGPIRDTGAEAASAFNAGRSTMQAARQQPQQLSDEIQARKLMTLQNNSKLLQMQVASSHLNHEMLDQMTSDAQTFLQPFKDYDDNRSAEEPSAFLARGLSADDIIKPKSPYKLTDSNVVIDGTQQVYNPETKQYEAHPTYAVINPALKDLQLPKEVADKLAETNSQYKDIHAVTGGNLRLPVNLYVSAMHEYQTVTQGEHILDTLSKELNGDKAQAIDLAPVVRANRRAMLPALNQMEQAVAAGNTASTRPSNVLDTILKTPNGDKLLTLLGLTPEQAQDKIDAYENERIRKATLAKEGGIGDKAPAPASMIADLTAAAKKLHPDQAQAIMAGINPNGLTVGEAEKIKNNILSAQNSNTSNSQPTAAGPTPTGFVFSPDAPTMDSPTLRSDLTKQGVKLPSNFEALYGIAHNANPLTTLPTNPRKGSNQMSAQEGLAFIRQYINPNYQEGDYQAAASLSKELASTRQGTAGGTLYNAGTASQHLELLDEAATALNNHDVQGLNRLANAFGVSVGQSPAVTFKAIAEQVNGEVGKVVAGGTPHEAELSELRSNLNSDQSPEQTKKVIKAYVNLMAGRINEINERSQQYFNRDVKGVSPTTAKVFNTYGVPAPGQVKVTLNGQSFIAQKNQVAAIQKKYPTAVIGE